MAARKKWSELSTVSRTALVVGGGVQILLQLAALRDISQRTPEQVNGSKRGWVAASFINFLGPLAWFKWGRRD
ncbi:PLDc N-terminal domain-containing protein [Arthrobacter psychrolactophilus]